MYSRVLEHEPSRCCMHRGGGGLAVSSMYNSSGVNTVYLNLRPPSTPLNYVPTELGPGAYPSAPNKAERCNALEESPKLYHNAGLYIVV